MNDLLSTLLYVAHRHFRTDVLLLIDMPVSVLHLTFDPDQLTLYLPNLTKHA